MKRFGLIGNNISYSLSKIIHQEIAKINNLKIIYEIIDITIDKLEKYVNLLKEGYYQGFNITIPYKESIIPFLDYITEAALEIGAVNTIYLDKDKVIGDNTDYLGFDYTLKRSEVLNKPLKDVYILGSGGAAKACYYVFKKRGIKPTIVSRSGSKTYFEKVITYQEFKKVKEVDLLINTTPLGNINNPAAPIEKSKQVFTTIIDLTYYPKKTILMSYSENSFSGLEMLIYQAIAAQKRWHKLNIDSEIILEKVKGVLENESVWQTI